MAEGELQTDSESDVQQDTIQDVEWIVDETAGGGGWTVFVHNDGSYAYFVLNHERKGRFPKIRSI